MLDLTLPRGALTLDMQRHLAAHLTHIAIRWEEWDIETFPERNDVAQGLTWVFFHEVEPHHIFTAGQPTQRPIYRLVTHFPQGAVNERTRAGYVRDVTQAILDAEGVPMDRENAQRVWSIIREIQEGSWGGAGQIVGLAQLASFIYGDPEQGHTFAEGRITALAPVVQ